MVSTLQFAIFKQDNLCITGGVIKHVFDFFIALMELKKNSKKDNMVNVRL